MQIITKDDLINALREVRNKGWIPNARHGNAGGVGKGQEVAAHVASRLGILAAEEFCRLMEEREK